MASGAFPAAIANFNHCYDDFVLGRSFVEDEEYYRFERRRYRRTFEKFCRLNIAPQSELLEIGGGQFAILCNRLLGMKATVGDIVEDARSDIEAAGLEYLICNLLGSSAELDNNCRGRRFDVIALLEVIEHLPIPPYLVFNRLAGLLKPGGYLILTTPNLFRVRNILFMMAGRDFLDRFQQARPNISLGHQLEYSASHMAWQVNTSKLDLICADPADLSGSGHSLKAQLFHIALAPINLVPHLRPSLWVVAQRPKGDEA